MENVKGAWLEKENGEERIMVRKGAWLEKENGGKTRWEKENC